MQNTAEKVSKYGVFSDPYIPAFGLNTRDTKYLFIFNPNVGKYGPEKTPYLDTFHAVKDDEKNAIKVKTKKISKSTFLF